MKLVINNMNGLNLWFDNDLEVPVSFVSDEKKMDKFELSVGGNVSNDNEKPPSSSKIARRKKEVRYEDDFDYWL